MNVQLKYYRIYHLIRLWFLLLLLLLLLFLLLLLTKQKP